MVTRGRARGRLFPKDPNVGPLSSRGSESLSTPRKLLMPPPAPHEAVRSRTKPAGEAIDLWSSVRGIPHFRALMIAAWRFLFRGRNDDGWFCIRDCRATRFPGILIKIFGKCQEPGKQRNVVVVVVVECKYRLLPYRHFETPTYSCHTTFR